MMAVYVLLTRLSAGAIARPESVVELNAGLEEHIRQ
jgi:hypothetical protein